MYLLKKKNIINSLLVHPEESLKPVLFVTMLGSTVAPTLGTIFLFGSGLQSLDGILVSWGVWWMGDFFGVVIFTPFVLSYLYRKNNLWRLRAKYIVPVVLVSVAISIGFFFQIEKTNAVNINTTIENRVNKINWTLSDLFKSQVEVANDLGFSLQYDQSVTKEKFKNIAMHLLEKKNGVFGFSWNKMITHGELDEVAALIKKRYPESLGITELNSEGDLVPLKKADIYSVVALIYPLIFIKDTVGLNQWANPIRRAVMTKAIETKSAQFTEIFQLLTGDFATLAFYPVFDDLGAIQGFATIVIRLDQMAKELVSDMDLSGLNLKLIDQTVPSKPTIILKFEELKLVQGDENEATAPNEENDYTKVRILNVGGRDFVLNVTPTTEYLNSLASFSSWIALVILQVVTGLLVFLLLVLTGREKAISRVVNERTAELESAVSVKSDFLANMSHELRTPLNAIIGFSEVMRNKMFGPLGNEKYDEYAKIIHSSGHHLLGIVNDILDLSRVEGENFEVNLTPISIVTEVENSVSIMQKLAEEKNLELILETKIEGEDFIRMDSRLFNQMIFNLLGNAIKFTNEGSIKVNLDLLDPNEDETLLIFRVQDTGIGISAENVEKFFNRFEQVGATFTKVYEGTGLGLSICKKFVEAMGGAISCESRLGVGTCFYVSIPVQRCGFQEELFVAE
jgi:signal transduction histidine kinase